MQLYKDDNLTVVLDSEHRALLLTWNGYTSDDTYFALLDKVYGMMEEHRIIKTLNDVRGHKGITPKSQDYAAERSLEFSKKHWAIKRRAMVFNPDHDIFSKFGAQRFVKKVEEVNYEQQHREFFDNLEEAKAWLLQD